MSRLFLHMLQAVAPLCTLGNPRKRSPLAASRLTTWTTAFGVCFVLFAASIPANAQFKEVGPPPGSAAVARQQIRTLLEKVDASNRQQTVDTISGLLVWYRDIFDEELIAAWKGDGRANLTQLMVPLADSRVASAIVESSWRQQREATFTLAYAPMLGDLMARYPESAKPFLGDLLAFAAGPVANGQQTPDLPRSEAEAVCRIFLDMPDLGTWRKSALQFLPRYRRVAENLLIQDLHGNDQEKSYRAQTWLKDLKSDVPDITGERQSPRRTQPPSLSRAAMAPVGSDPIPAPVRAGSAAPPIPAPAQNNALPWNGATSGTLECGGGPIPQNAEYVFRDLPPVKIQLDYDTRIWDARLTPGSGQTQRLILKNKSSGPQKRCVVRWSVIP